MAASVASPLWLDVDNFIEAYESAQVQGGKVDLRNFLPPREHPGFLRIVQELFRVDLEYAWQRGERRFLEDYQPLCPELFADPHLVLELTYEEYRLRKQAGETPARREYEQRFGINASLWPQASRLGVIPPSQEPPQPTISPSEVNRRGQPPLPSDVVILAPTPKEALALHATEGGRDQGMPLPGTQYLGFHILDLLGKGAFSRVYVAQQTDLANRHVVLKIATDMGGEPYNLAQLQHTNIVPIFSVHQTARHQVVCMPYFGATTVSDVLDDLKARAIVPDSGKKLLSTLNDRKQKTRSRVSSSPSSRVDGGDPKASSLNLKVNRQALQSAEPPAATLQLLEGYSYVQVIVWMATRLADALAHAHDRGILHRDIKPANILISDDNQPMLLDFNLSVDVKSCGTAQAAFIGGTLPYMAPEHLEAFQGQKRPVDARSDLYSLGVVLYELLTLRHPFPVHSGPVNSMLPRLLHDRAGRPPHLRLWNPAISPAVEAIIRKCMEPRPQNRYQSAQEFREDLERHLSDRPLTHAKEPSLRERFRKWRRRHPRLASGTAVMILAGLMLAALGTVAISYRERNARLEATAARLQTSADLREVERHLVGAPNTPLARVQGQETCRRIMTKYQLDQPGWDRAALVAALPVEEQNKLRADLNMVLFHYAETGAAQATQERDPQRRRELARVALQANEAARHLAPTSRQNRALWFQAHILHQLTGDKSAAEEIRRKLTTQDDRTADDHYQMGALLFGQHRYKDAAEHLRQASTLEAGNFAVWFLLGRCQSELGQFADALVSYNTCLALRGDAFLAHLYRGIMFTELGKPTEALADFARALELQPDLLPEVLVNRARCRELQRDYAGAVEDLTAALARDAGGTRLYFWRAKLRQKLGQAEEAQADLRDGLQRPPTDEASWTARGEARAAQDAQGALADFDQALLLNPHFRNALQGKANVLSEKLKRDAEAVEVLNQLLTLYPQYEKGLAGRGVLLARLGKRDAAHADARQLLELGPKDPVCHYQVANIYALTSLREPADRALALQHLAHALSREPRLLRLVAGDSDLAPLQGDALLQQLVQTLGAIQQPAPRRP